VRAMLRPVTAGLDSHMTLHDFRHTCATRLANDPNVPLTDLQAVLRHVRITTTARYIQPATADVVRRFQEHQQCRVEPPENPVWRYESSDLDVLSAARDDDRAC
jgi:hypothetical protein